MFVGGLCVACVGCLCVVSCWSLVVVCWIVVGCMVSFVVGWLRVVCCVLFVVVVFVVVVCRCLNGCGFVFDVFFFKIG